MYNTLFPDLRFPMLHNIQVPDFFIVYPVDSVSFYSNSLKLKGEQHFQCNYPTITNTLCLFKFFFQNRHKSLTGMYSTTAFQKIKKLFLLKAKNFQWSISSQCLTVFFLKDCCSNTTVTLEMAVLWEEMSSGYWFVYNNTWDLIFLESCMSLYIGLFQSIGPSFWLIFLQQGMPMNTWWFSIWILFLNQHAPSGGHQGSHGQGQKWLTLL